MKRNFFCMTLIFLLLPTVLLTSCSPVGPYVGIAAAVLGGKKSKDTPPAPTMPTKVSNPSPPAGAVDVPVTTDLGWDSAPRTDSYDIYFGTSAISVANADTSSAEFKGNQAGLSYDPPGYLGYETMYYWRIDSVNVAGVTKGDLWGFSSENEPTTPPEQVTSPKPVDDAADVSINVTLGWDSAAGASSYDIYLGTGSLAVTNATRLDPEFKGNVTSLSYPISGLSYTTDYYWRIDSVNVVGTTKGLIWHFTTETSPVNTPPSVTIQTPAGSQSGAISLTYDLSDAENNNCDVTVEYSDDGGAGWNSATLVSASAGTISGNVIQGVSPDTGLTFEWNSTADGVGVSALNSAARIRIRAFDGQDNSNYAQTTNFTVDNTTLALEIVTSSLPDGILNQSYSRTIQASGGTTPYTWDLTGTMPPGVTWAQNGDVLEITGSPTSEGGYPNIQVSLTDSSTPLQSDNQTYTISIYQPLQISTTSLDNATVGQSYNATLSASGGKTTYSWSEVGTNLSTYGLQLNADGSISGTASLAGTCNFTAQVTDSASPAQSVQKLLTITIREPLQITTSSLPFGRDGESYSVTLNASGGVTPYTWSEVGSNLSAYALTLNADGSITGTPSQKGTCNFTAKVEDSSNPIQEVNKGLSITVGGTIHVDDAAGVDSNDGLSWATAVKTIQTGLDKASNAWTVLVADGTYTGTSNKDLDFAGKAVHLKSDGGAENCTIDCETAGRGFNFDDGEDLTSVVDGFTIQNGDPGAGGGGIFCTSASPTITNCIISNNTAGGWGGGGIYCYKASPAVVECTITGNSGGRGGAILCYYSASPSVTHCRISGNSANDGGGIYAELDCILALTHCIISKNSATYGGGIFGIGDNVVLTLYNCTICNNSATAGESYGDGGGIICRGHSSSTISNCTILNNSATKEGGGIYCGWESPTITNCVIAYNSADVGGGLHCTRPMTVNNSTIAYNVAVSGGGGIYCSTENLVLNNCIIWGNRAAGWHQFWLSGSSSTPILNFSNYSNATDDTGGEGTLIPSNCTSLDPQFAGSGSCRLLGTSPCIDAGDNSLVPGGVSEDVLGAPRIVDGDDDTIPTVDMGAYEYQGAIYVDDAGGSDADDGLSWPTAVQTIQKGLQLADNSWTVFVADGTYMGASNKNLDFAGKAIHLKSIGGAASCIIDSENDGRGFYFHSGETGDAIVEGFTIQNGDTTESGGGIHCSSSSPAITNCTISGNTAADYGGGIYCCSSSSPIITNCIIESNSVTTHGGGGIHCNSSSPTIINCTIADNSAANGGGIDFYQSSSPSIINCTIADNPAQYGGGIGCYESSPILNNSILWGNSAASEGNQIHSYDSGSTVILNYCDCADGGGDIEGSGTVIPDANCINLDPLFVDAPNGNYRLLGGSPCLDAGGNSLVPIHIVTDLDGGQRIWRSVDMGAYEGGWLFVPSTYSTIQSAITASTDGDTVWVADGTYTGLGNKNLFFEGRVIALRSENGPDNCIIDCENDGCGFYFYYSGETTDSVIDGFTIRNGDVTNDGGGIHCHEANPTITNCIIENCYAGRYGGGIYCIVCYSVIIRNCIIVNNSADYGGGIEFYRSDPTVTNCFIASNTARGGGIECYRSNPVLNNCTLADNSGTNRGGGLYCSTTSNPVLNNCILWGNTASVAGAQIYTADTDCSVTLYYCDCSNNSGDIKGVGNVTLSSCIALDPLFVAGPKGNYYLSQIAAGQGSDSPCLDSGSDSAANLGLDGKTTRTDTVTDTGTVDMGYHYDP